MDNSGEGVLPVENVDGEQPSNLNISDVIDAITKADPLFGAGVEMPRPTEPNPGEPFVRIVEQPASKALRFRYECEGRSAGSIPGVNSKPERKTYPTIEVCGIKGQAIVVVSCVTRDEPFKPHPHNLVGRERCENGVCTVRVTITDENNQVSFSNLGIQCVKKKDIPEALKTREKLRVDPFKTGYSHRSQPQSIDLNAVRLCFQVFFQDERTGRIRHSLTPVVSDVIYDKKAMSDLVIMRLSQCSDFHKGGSELILLCERVSREDIAVVFFQTKGDVVVWEESANIVLVHKQAAIAFHTPPYRDVAETKHVQVYLQLRRLSDNERSPPVPFEYIPEWQGTTRKPLPDLGVLSLLLTDSPSPARPTDGNNNSPEKQDLVSSTSDSPDPPTIELTDVVETNGVIGNDVMVVDTNERSLNDLLDQVAELDEIYSENRTRLENVSILNDENDLEEFNDAGTYTSLQLAFKNPVTITEPESLPYEDVQVQTYRGPIIEFTQLKRDTEDERAPPLPPKRVRKTTENFKTSQTSVDSILKPGKLIPITRNPDALTKKSELTVARSEPALPSPPKKRSFFSRLFRRKEKSPAPSVKSEGKREGKSKPVGRSVSSVSGLRPSKFKSSVSHASLKDNASGAGLSYADSVTHISLHGDGDDKSQTSLKRPASLAPLPPTDGSILVAESVLALDAGAFRKLQDELELTEAEHYALYMAVAPRATVSEFDDTSCYYSPVDGNANYLKRKRTKTLSPSIMSNTYEQEKYGNDQQIKSEPRDKTPPHQTASPLRVFSPPYEQEQLHDNQYQWSMQGPSMGLSQANYGQQEMQWNQGYIQLTSTIQPASSHMPDVQLTNLQNIQPNMHTLSPNMQTMSSNIQPLSPSMQMSMGQMMTHGGLSPRMGQMSPGMGQMSPGMGQMSPGMGQMSPGMGQMSPGMGHISPGMGQMSPAMSQMSPAMSQMSPGMGHVSPGMGHVSPAMGHISPNLVQQQQAESLSALSLGELSGLSALLERAPDLSDSLNRLSTSDLLH